MATSHYDLVVIGSGPAGERGATQAALLGKRVAVIEKNTHPGGAAANTGTLPSKTLRETALFLSGYRQRDLYGIDACLRDRATVQDFLRRERRVKETERQRILGNLGRHRIDLIAGEARFIAPGQVRVGEALEVSGDVFLIATGSHPFRPAVYPFGQPDIFDTDTILEIDRIPCSMLIAGGGVIGCEYACIFATLGVAVTVVESRDALLPFLDNEVARVLKERMIALGIEFRMPDAVAFVQRDDDGEQQGWQIALESGESLVVEIVLVASGRSGNTDSLGLETIGVTPGTRGQIVVNERFETQASSVYAVGDVIGFPALASTSMEQARLAVLNAFDPEQAGAMVSILPYGIYTIPEVSSAGLSEEEARERGIEIVVGRARFAANARGQIIGDTYGFLKLVFRSDDLKLIGVHVLGDQASELVHIGLTAMLCEAGAELFVRTCYNYPTLSKAYKYAAYDAIAQRSRTARQP